MQVKINNNNNKPEKAPTGKINSIIHSLPKFGR